MAEAENHTCLRIELFDGLRVRRGEEVITRFRTQKTAALLAYLALFPARVHTREHLSELFWPDYSPAMGRHSLSNALHALRLQLESPGCQPVFLADRSTVRLNAALITTDVTEFEAARQEAKNAPSPEGCAAAMARAIRLCCGELLRGMYEDWIFPEQARLGAQCQKLLDGLIAHHEAEGRLEEAIDLSLKAVRDDPLCEAARHRLMRLYVAAGQGTVAQSHYQDLERQLRRELDAVPGPELRKLLKQIQATVREAPPAPAAGAAPEPVGGAVPLTSPLYVERTTDREFRDAIQRGESIVLVKGPHQSGKTSLLARGLQHARERGARVVLTDLQTLANGESASPETFLLALAESLTDQLDLPERPRDGWDPDRGPALNLRRFLRRSVFREGEAPLVWGLDEVDRLFALPFGDGVFGMFRSWHNERALDPAGPWSRLTLALAHATEAHLYISDLSQSPFNVGVRLELQDFTAEQVADLNGRCGEPLSAEELARFRQWVGGHPYLVRRALHEMVRRGIGLSALLDVADGVFGDHTGRLRQLLARSPDLTEALRALLQDQSRPPEAIFFRLRSAGVLSGDTAREARWRCGLYEQVLHRHLMP